MNIKDYISIIAIERLLGDKTLPADVREQAEDTLAELLETNKELFFTQVAKGE